MKYFLGPQEIVKLRNYDWRTGNLASTMNSGQQGFATGATRSKDDNKIDFEGHIHPEVQHFFGEYMHRHRVQTDGQMRASDNWQLGIPLHKYMKSLARHTLDLFRLWRGYETTNPDNGKVQSIGELLCAIRFNVDGLLLELIRAGGTHITRLDEQQRVDLEKGGHSTAVFQSQDNWADVPRISPEELERLRDGKAGSLIPGFRFTDFREW